MVRERWGWAVVTAATGTVLIGVGAFWLSFMALADLAAQIATEHGPEYSGFRILDSSYDGLYYRLLLMDSARTSLDIQTYLWYPDASGSLILERAVLAARQAEGDGAGRGGPRVDRLRRLPPGMADLHDEGSAMALRRLRPACKAVELLIGQAGADDDIADLLQMVTIDLDIARNDAAKAAIRPAAVEPAVRFSDPIAHICESLCHRRLHETVGECQPALQG